MTRDEAQQLLGLDDRATPDDVHAAHGQLWTEYQVRLTNAPTPKLKRLYQQTLHELDAARALLLGGGEEPVVQEAASDLPSAQPAYTTSFAANELRDRLLTPRAAPSSPRPPAPAPAAPPAPPTPAPSPPAARAVPPTPAEPVSSGPVTEPRAPQQQRPLHPPASQPPVSPPPAVEPPGSAPAAPVGRSSGESDTLPMRRPTPPAERATPPEAPPPADAPPRERLGQRVREFNPDALRERVAEIQARNTPPQGALAERGQAVASRPDAPPPRARPDRTPAESMEPAGAGALRVVGGVLVAALVVVIALLLLRTW